jgi:hypothetical protein
MSHTCVRCEWVTFHIRRDFPTPGSATIAVIDVHWSEGLDLVVAFDQPEGLGDQQDRPRRRHLLHASGQMRGLPDSGVVHMKVAADGPNDNLA